MDAPAPPAPEAADEPCPHCGRPVGDAWMVCAWCGEQIAAPAELPVGAELCDGRYRVLGTIGRGGFGITYDVGDTRLKRRVAVKELFPESAVRHGSVVLTPPHARAAFRASKDRFLREARVLARFTHPGIVRVYEVFEEHGTAYLVMERLGGRTLVDVLRARQRPFAEDEVLDVAARVAAALRPVHAAGVLHRDLNPSNVMLTEHGRIVLIDFGLARDFDLDHTVGMTRVVTPGYAPLEQYRGEGRFGPATDVYGLAATLYRLATGKVPVPAVERDAGVALPAPRRVNPAISKPLSDALLDGLELEPGHRPRDLDAFLARLGITRLPDAPRSLLLGSEGAELDALRAAAPTAFPARLPDPPAPPDPPEPSELLDDPGPAAPVLPATAVVDAGARPTELDPDRTVHGPTPGVAAADRTEVPGTASATEAVAGWDGDRTVAAPHQRSSTTASAPAPPTAAAPAPMTVQAARPGEGHGLPLAVGPHRPGWRKVTVPLLVLCVATAMAAPVLVTGLLVLVLLPALATYGDAVAHQLRSAHGIAGGWGERRLPPGLLAPARFVRNLAVSILRASPIIGVAVVLLAAWYALAETSLPVGLVEWVLRLLGAGTAAALLLSAREGSSRFRTGLGLDEVVRRAAPEGRTTERLVVGWLVVALVAAASLWLSPDPFPLP